MRREIGSLSALDMCTGRNPSISPTITYEVYRPWICALAGTRDLPPAGEEQSIGLGYVHWPELTRPCLHDCSQSIGLGYVHWPELRKVGHDERMESIGLGYVHWPELNVRA